MTFANGRVLLGSKTSISSSLYSKLSLFTRQSSLSAIHRGLRRSEKARPQGFRHAEERKPPNDPEVSSKPLTFADRRRARIATQPTFRIRKGKKDITELPEELQPQSRSSRFNDPEKSFGKKSLVYQLKHGQLGAELEALQQRQKEKDLGRTSKRGPATERPRRTDESPMKRGERVKPRERNDLYERKPRQVEDPVSVPYTTAASQFLYGTSTVEAALRAGRRKLYTLYVYSGLNRQNVAQDRIIERLAQRSGVRIVKVEEPGLRMMDKMSGGRPHNGYILETSPLPQLPLSGLGPVSMDENAPGYSLILGHQSHEEAQVNGASDFIKTSSKTHKPLVLVLDQVLDPGNLGAILRTASFLGVSAVAISKKNSASLTPVALKASAGASESLTLFSIESPASFLVESRKAGWQVYAAVPASSRSKRRKQVDTIEVEESDPLSTDPCILLMGSEGEGLSNVLRDKADVEVNIPNNSGSNIIDSLNVSVATGLLCSSFLRGQEKARYIRAQKEDPLF